MRKYFLIFILVAISGCSAGNASTAAVDEEYVASTLEWRAGRLAALRAEDGYLNLAGLFWLGEGKHSFGSAADNDIVFPATAPEYIGDFEITPDGVVMQIYGDADVRAGDEPVDTILMHADTTETPVTVALDALAWNVIHRQRKFAVRLRDFEHPALDGLPPIPHFEIDPAYRVEATMQYFDEPRTMNVGTVIEGLGYNPESSGVVEFEIDGQTMQLDAYNSGERLFFVFGDRTSGRETYGAGKFLYADAPDENGRTTLDFNRSYNPPCAFGDFSTCPVASPQNRLPVRIEAGERFIPELFVGNLTH